MEYTKETLEELIRDRYGSVPKMAEAIGKSAQTIYTCLNNLLVGSYFTTSMPIIAALGLDPYELLEGRLVTRPERDLSYANVALYDSAPAKRHGEHTQPNQTVPIPAEMRAEHPDAFLMRVSGKTMNLAFPDGVFVLVDPCTDVAFPGDPYVVHTPAGGTAIKRAYALENGIELHPYSSDPTMKPIVYDFDTPQGAGVSVIGHVVWATYPLDWRFDANAR